MTVSIPLSAILNPQPGAFRKAMRKEVRGLHRSMNQMAILQRIDFSFYEFVVTYGGRIVSGEPLVNLTRFM